MNQSFKNFLYYRYIIQKCTELNKVLLIHCEYNGICLSDSSKLTFINIIPYLPEVYNVSIIADHINLDKNECAKYINVNSLIKGHKFIIVGKPYIYKNKNDDIKGGLILSNELEKFGIKPICFWTPKYLKNIPYNLIIDFRKEFDGIYGWKQSNINTLYITSEQEMLKTNNNIDKYSFSINYSENLINKDDNYIDIDSSKEEIIFTNNIIKNENILFNIISSNKNVKKNIYNKKYCLKNNNIIIEVFNKNKIIRNIDNNLREFSDSIKIQPIITDQRLPNGVVIPPYRRK